MRTSQKSEWGTHGTELPSTSSVSCEGHADTKALFQVDPVMARCALVDDVSRGRCAWA